MQARQPAGVKWVARVLYALMLLVLVCVAWWAIAESTPEVPPPSMTPLPPPHPQARLPAEPGEPPPLAVAPAPAPASDPSSSPRLQKGPVDPEVLARETALLERARSEVKSEPQAALRTVAEHRKVFPTGPHAQEAELVQVEALLRLGRREEAESLGRKLVSADQSVTRAVERLLRDVRSN